MPLAFGARVRPAHFTFQCWQRLSESNAHDPCGIIVGFKPTKHATCEPPYLAESGPLEGHAAGRHPSVSNRVQGPACFTLLIGARLRTCTSPLPLTRRAHRCLCVTGKLVGRAGIAPASLHLKGGSLSR